MSVGLRNLLLFFFSIAVAKGKDCIIPGNKTSMMQYNGNVSHGIYGVECEKTSIQSWAKGPKRTHTLCRLDENDLMDVPWCYSNGFYKTVRKCDVPICGSLDISDATIKASSRMQDPKFGSVSHLTDSLMRTTFSTICGAVANPRRDEWVTITMREVHNIRFVVLIPSQELGHGKRASRISIYAREVKKEIKWRKCAFSAEMDRKMKQFTCKARTQEIQLSKWTTYSDEEVCLELSEVYVIKDPNGWTDWSSWSQCSSCERNRTRICERIGYGGEPCGRLNATETETNSCCSTSTTSTSVTSTSTTPTLKISGSSVSNRPLSAKELIEKGAPYAAAFVILLVLLNILALY